MRHLAVPLLLATLSAGCDPDHYCSPGATRACICESTGQAGRETCEPTGAAFGPCDCTQAACEPAATRACVGNHVWSVDSCGNVDPIAVERCACPCVEGATSCAAASVPPAVTVGPSCTDDTACLTFEFPECVYEGWSWWGGAVITNRCDHAIRCYVHASATTFRTVSDGYMELTEYLCILPPRWPSLAAGESVDARSGLPTLETCHAERDAWLTSPIRYFACVAADDPADTCLPDLPTKECPPSALAPLCGAP